ncbi:MAG: rod shape-determining protein RodA [Burkholderiaceae bacterium]
MNNDAPLMSVWRRAKPYVFVFDPLLSIILALLCGFSLVTLYSAGYDFPGRFEGQVRNFVAAFLMMWFIASIPPQKMMRFAIPVYTIGVLLLIAVFAAGTVKNGARRWLTVGSLQIQPSELLKIGVPLMLAWYFHKHETLIRLRDFVFAGLMLVVPVGLIAKQPDLGTALLVLAAGIYVIYFAGLSWKLILPVLVAAVVGATALIFVGDRICQPEVNWPGMHDYQKQRICTLLDPTTDPLGRGFHTIQSAIAVGSGGLTGKGYMKGTQTHLDFIPERTTDFILAVYAEEFGFVGIILLLCLYAALIFRGLVIAANAPTYFARLLAGSITLIFFTYAFVNMGMVSGILPVVGVPLPFMSYGGTALVTLGIGAGILMSVQRHKKLVQT